MLDYYYLPYLGIKAVSYSYRGSMVSYYVENMGNFGGQNMTSPLCNLICSEFRIGVDKRLVTDKGLLVCKRIYLQTIGQARC